MAERVSNFFPHIFRPTEAGSKEKFSLWFDTAEFAQLSISEFLPHRFRNFSKVGLSANVLSLSDNQSGMCKCLAPVNFYTHAFTAIAKGNFSEDVNEALEMLGKYIENEESHISCIMKMMTEDKITEQEILLVYAHHLFEPLLPNAELLVDKNTGIDASKCPFCNEKKETVKSGSTSFGVPGMWHGNVDIVLKHGKVRQTVIVAQTSDDDSGEPAEKRQRIDAGEPQSENCRTGSVEVKKDLSWTVLSKRGQHQDPVPQLLSQTIVNAFLVAKVNENLRNFFIPSFLVSQKGVKMVMYNVTQDSLVTQVDCHPLLFDQKLNRRIAFTLWIALNFDKFRLDKSVDIITRFLRPCGFRDKIVKYDVQTHYEQEVCEDFEDKSGVNDVYMAGLDMDARLESWKILPFS